MKLSSQAYHKQKQAEHTWTVTYVDRTSNKACKFTCSTAMQKSHAIMLRDNPYVKDVCFVKGVK